MIVVDLHFSRFQKKNLRCGWSRGLLYHGATASARVWSFGVWRGPQDLHFHLHLSSFPRDMCSVSDHKLNPLKAMSDSRVCGARDFRHGTSGWLPGELLQTVNFPGERTGQFFSWTWTDVSCTLLSQQSGISYPPLHMTTSTCMQSTLITFFWVSRDPSSTSFFRRYPKWLELRYSLTRRGAMLSHGCTKFWIRRGDILRCVFCILVRKHVIWCQFHSLLS